jgi:hypothetical protein
MVEARALAEAGMYRLDFGGQGMVPVKSTIALHPKRIYFIGAHSSPDMVITTQVTDTMVTYVKPPSRKEIRAEAPIFAHLAQKGTETYLKRHAELEARLGIKTQGARLRASLADLLAGGKGLPVDPRDYEKVTAYVVPVPGADFSGERNGDAWYAAEGYGNVGGTDVDGQQGYEISYMDRGTLLDLKKDKRFKVVRVVDEKHA